MSDHFQFDVFLSHNQADKVRVRRLAERLKAAGLRVWLDEWVIQPGDMISLKVDEGLEQSRVLLLCISPNALASEWVALERSTAIHRDPANAGRRFIPLLLADCKLPDTLRRYRYVDYREDSASAFSELLTACRPETGVVPPTAKLAPTKEPVKKNPQPQQPHEVTQPLAVLERELTGHKNWVKSVAVTPDGKWIASGSDDMTVKIWDRETGEMQRTLSIERSRISITANGQIFLASFGTDPVLVCNFDSGEVLGELRVGAETWTVIPLADNRRVLTGSWNNTLQLWDLTSYSCIKTFVCGSEVADNIFSGAVNRAGTLALSGHRDGRIRIWNLQTSECLATLKGHSDLVLSVQTLLDDRFAVSGSKDTTVKIWDLESHECVGTLEGHRDRVQSVAISPDGGLIASTGFVDSSVRLWHWKSGACLQVIKYEPNSSPTAVAFNSDGSRLVVGTSEGTIYVYRLTGVRPTPAVEATRRYVNAKVVLIGEGTIGKTSLAHRLIDDEYIIKDRTHGMNVWRLDLPDMGHASSVPLPDRDRHAEELPDIEREALLWDLAGQEDYRLIHQLFLDETALALLLVNPQKDDPFAEAGDWLKSLQTAARNLDSKREAARLLIFSQIDVGGMKLGNAKIERFREQYGFADWLPTSAKTGENCSDKENQGKPSKLKQLIAASIPWSNLPWTSTPRLLAEMKNAVMSMRDGTDIRLLRFRELAQRLEQMLPAERIGEFDVRTAVTLLANHGLARLLKFGDLVLLRPDLLNGYAGAIIRAARAHTDEIGCVLEANIYKPDFDFTGVERLTHRPDEELLLRALVQTFLDHSLCIAEETPHGRHLVFPSQYRREKDLPHEPDIFVSYTFSGEWQTVWTTLVVRLWYSQEFTHRELWRNAAEFESPKGYGLGLKIVNTQGEGEATISLYFDVQVPDELKVIFIEYIHRHLAKYASNVTRDRRYVCGGCGRPFKDLDLIRELLAEKQATIVCQRCRTEVELVDFIEQRLKSDPVARKILAMEETATRELADQALEQRLIGHLMAITGEANQIFRLVAMADFGIDGEVEFKDNDGRASGKRIYIQLKSDNCYSRTRTSDGREIFDVKNERHLEYWLSQPVDVYLVIRQQDEMSGEETIRWMNVTRTLKNRKDRHSRQIVFDGHKLDMNAVWNVRDEFFPPAQTRK